MLPDTTLGPLANIAQAETIEKQIEQSIKKGAKLILGGKRNGANFEPTLLIDVKPGMPAFDEELFGPVACIIEAEDADQTVSLANNHRYGLGATIFSQDYKQAMQIAAQLSSGSVFINSMVRSDLRLPFGGVKKSGYGRELSINGLKEFMHARTIFVTHD